MSVTVTIAGSSYSYPSLENNDSWGSNATTSIQAICNNAIWKTNVVDNLTSYEANKVLAANQGKIINDSLSSKFSTSNLDTTPTDNSDKLSVSKWIYDNIYNASYEESWKALPSKYVQQREITHNLNTAFENLEFKIIYSPSGGTDPTDYEDITFTNNYSEHALLISNGQYFYNINNPNKVLLCVCYGDLDQGGCIPTSSGIFLPDNPDNQAICKVIIRKRIFK